MRTTMPTVHTALGPGGELAALSEVAATSPTTCPQWLRAWYPAFGEPESDPVLLAHHADDNVAGYLALTWRRRGPGGALRDLWSTTNGQSQYTALWIAPGAEDAVIGCFLAALEKQTDWDRLYLQGLPQPMIDRIIAAAPQLRPNLAYRFDNRMVAAAPDTIRPEHLPSAKTLRKMRGQMRQLADQGDLQMHRVADRAEIGPLIERYMQAETASWKRDSGELLDDGGAVARFYRALMVQADDAFRPVIWTFTYESEILAGLLMLENRTEWVMLKVFYNADHARYSLGRNLLFAAIGAARDDPDCARLDVYSHLAKYDSFASHAEPFGDLVLWNRGARATALRQVYRGLAGLRGGRLVSPTET